jgi:hypothetical protein
MREREINNNAEKRGKGVDKSKSFEKLIEIDYHMY